MASAIAMIMGFVQLAHRRRGAGLRGLFYRGPAGGGKDEPMDREDDHLARKLWATAVWVADRLLRRQLFGR